MSSSRLLSTIPLFSRSQARWPEPELSTARYRGIKKGKLHCWDATGPARDAFEKIQEQIRAHLNREGIQVPSSSIIMFDIFMIGRAQATARPCIMFSCKHRQSREKAVAVIKESNILDQCPLGIKIGDWDYPPHLKNLRQLALSAVGSDVLLDSVQIDEDIDSYNRRVYPVVDRKSGKVRTLQLATQSESAKNRHPRMATIGSVIELEGKLYYVVPSHIFNSNEAEVISEEDILSEDSECGLEDFEFDEEALSDAQDEADFMSQYSASPDASDIEEDWDLDDGNTISDGESIQDLDERSEQLRTIMMVTRDEASTSFDDAELALVDDHAFSMTGLPHLSSQSLDYCLIEIEDGENVSKDLPVLSRDTIGQLDRKSVNVTAVTGLGSVLKGVISGQRSCIRLPGATKYINVLTVQFEGSLQPGNCGSIVRDAITDRIYGYLVAGDTESQFAFIVPATDVLDDVMTKLLDLESASAGSSQLPFIRPVHESNQKNPSVLPRHVSNFIGYSSKTDTSSDGIKDSDQTAVTGTLTGGFYAGNICEPCADAIVNHAVKEPGDIAPTSQTLHPPRTVRINDNADEADERTSKLIHFLTELSLPRDLDEEMQGLDLVREQKGASSADLNLPIESPQGNQTSPHTEDSNDSHTRSVSFDFLVPNQRSWLELLPASAFFDIPLSLHDIRMNLRESLDIPPLPQIEPIGLLSPYDMCFTSDTGRTSRGFPWIYHRLLDTTVNFGFASHTLFDADDPNDAQKGNDSLSLASGVLDRTKSPRPCPHCRLEKNKRPVHTAVLKRHVEDKHYPGYKQCCHYDDCRNRCPLYFPRCLDKVMGHYGGSKIQEYSPSNGIPYPFNDGDPRSAKGFDSVPSRVAGHYPDSVSHIILGVVFSKSRAKNLCSVHSWSGSHCNKRRPSGPHPEFYECLFRHCVKGDCYVRHVLSPLTSRDTDASASRSPLRQGPLCFLFIPTSSAIDCGIQLTTTDQERGSSQLLVPTKSKNIQACISRQADFSAATQGGDSHCVQCNAGESNLSVPVSTMKTHICLFWETKWAEDRI